MPHPFQLTPTEIARLDEVTLVELLNRLLHLEAAALGVLPSDVETSLSTKAPDGGVDARTRKVPTGSLWLPDGLTVWQSKSGSAPTAKNLENEFKKPGVQAALQAGGSYILWIGDDISVGSPRKEKTRRETIEQCCIDAGYPKERCRLYFASQIAKWANQYLAVVLEFGHSSLGELQLWDQWQGLIRYRQRFVPDSQRTAIIEKFRERLAPTSQEFRFLRIEGLAGVGKSRLALEIFRKLQIADMVLYASQPEKVPADLWGYLSHNKTNVILVIDECTFAAHKEFCERAEPCNGRLHILTIGPRYQTESIPSGTTDIVCLETLMPNAMRELLQGSFGLMSEEMQDFITHVSSGFVKLAVVLADAMLRNKQLASATDLMRSRDVESILEALVPHLEDRKVLEVIALLRRVGWEGELSAEGEHLCQHLGVDWHDAQRHLIDIEKTRGIVARQGRYRYVTPHLLGVWLAASVYERIGPTEFMHIHSDILAPERRNDFEERVGDFGSDERTRPLIEALLSRQGLFPSLPALEGPDAARFLRLIGTARPEAGLSALERLIYGATGEQLDAFMEATMGGRVQVIWLLLAIAWREGLFERAASLMLELALHENKKNNIGPYASDEWRGFFRIHLGGTAASMDIRLTLLGKTLQDRSSRKRVLASAAIAPIFSFHENRMHHSKELGGAPLPAEWHPQNEEESAAIRRRALVLLEAGLGDAEPEVRAAAIEVLSNGARVAVRSGLADEYLALAGRIALPDYEGRHAIRGALEEAVEYEKAFLSEKQQADFLALSENMAGNSFQDRLRRYFGERTPGDRVHFRLGFDEEQRRYLEQAEGIVDEVLARPELLDSAWEWFFSSEAKNSYHFWWALGRKDASLRWWARVQEEAITNQRGYGMAPIYLRGQTEAGRLERDAVLDGWMAQGKPAAPLVIEAIWRNDLTDLEGERIVQMVEKKMLDPATLGFFYMGSAFSKLSVPVARKWIELALAANTEPALDAAIALLHLRMDRNKESEAYHDLALMALERSGGLWHENRDTMAAYYAAELGEILAPRYPVQMAQAVLAVYDTDDAPIGGDQLHSVLRRATEFAPETVWKLVADRLYPASDGDFLAAYRLRFDLGRWYIRLVPAQVLLTWAEQNGPDGPLHLAEMTDLGGDTMNPLPHELLVKYGANEELRNALYSQFVTGSWSGPMSIWLREKLRLAEIWAADADPNVRRWAIEVAGYLGERIQDAELQETERGY